MIASISCDEASEVARKIFGIDGISVRLAGDGELNFCINAPSGSKYILKCSLEDCDVENLEFQNAVLEYLYKQLRGMKEQGGNLKTTKNLSAPEQNTERFFYDETQMQIPRVLLSVNSKHIEPVTLNNTTYFIRLLTFLPGTHLAEVKPHSHELLFHLGEELAHLDLLLQDFSHPKMDWELQWDLRQAQWLGSCAYFIEDKLDREFVEKLLEKVEASIRPIASGLRRSLIHNDANDYNILVLRRSITSNPRLGLIDFGDMIHTYLISEVAIVATYAMLDKPDPLTTVSSIVAGYHSVLPILENEFAILFHLIQLRLLMTVITSAKQAIENPSNEYLQISAKPAWKLLRVLAEVHPNFAEAKFRHACGLPIHPCSILKNWLASQKFASICDVDLQVAKLSFLDLSPESAILKKIGTIEPIPIPYADLVIGKYNEPRLIYQDAAYCVQGNDRLEARTIHLGVDLFLQQEAQVYAPLDGTIHSFQNNAGPFDYGPTLILEHNANDTFFYTLYGHLSTNSLLHFQVGKKIAKGELLAEIGGEHENGGWPPHLHFQIITDLLGKKGEFPGVARPSERSLWLELCPDPNWILHIPSQKIPSLEVATESLFERRKIHTSNALSISYKKPLQIVRGFGAYLYDELGNQYLDTVNNVCHVGHCHPYVVKAGQEQMLVLNTNTRYLHKKYIDYSERLLALFPKPFEVCFLVCSGSEANELALRLAYAYTQSHSTLVLDHAYHGNTNTLISVSPYKFIQGNQGYPSTAPQLGIFPLPDLYRFHYSQDEYMNAISIPNKSVFLHESLPSCAGQVPLPEGFLNNLYSRVRKNGGICIADEVQVGFGRIGSHFWAFESQKVIPDIVTLGKPMGNGHPLAAVITTKAIAETLQMEYFNSFGGNPVSCAIGLAVLDVIENEQLQKNALEVGTYLKQKFHHLQKKFSIIGDIRGSGLFLGLELVLEPLTKEPAPLQTKYLVNRCREKGVLLSFDGPYHNVLKIKPPMSFSRKDADFLGKILEEVLDEIANNEL